MVDVFEMYKEEMGCQLVVGLFDNNAEFDDLQLLCTIPLEVRFEIPNIDTDLEPEPSTTAVVAAANNLESEAPEPSTAAANNLEADTDLEPE